MAAIISTWEQSAQFDPTNPHQIEKIQYAQIPGGYGSYYYNRVPTTATLRGLGGLLDGLSPMVQFGLVALASAAVGYFGYKRYGAQIEQRFLKRGK